MQKLRALELAHIAQGFHQGVQVVAVDRAKIVKTKFFKQRAGVIMPLTCSSARLTSACTGGAMPSTFGAFFHCGVKRPDISLVR